MTRNVADRRAGGTPRFIDPAVLARIDNLELLARTVVDGFVAGLHRSPHLGLSLDFAEHRAYMPGDDIRMIDWSLYARSDRFYVKQFEAETNANVVLALDVSASMGFGSGNVSKLDYGRFLAAALAFLSGRQRDRIGMVAFDAEPRHTIPPSVRHVDRILHTLDGLEPDGEGDVVQSILRLGDGLRRRGIFVLISDLYADPKRLAEVLLPLRFRGQDVIVFHLLDPAELDLSFSEAAMFRDAETGETMPVVPAQAREEYTERIQGHVSELERKLTGGRVDYVLLDTSKPLDYGLFRYLSMREAVKR